VRRLSLFNSVTLDGYFTDVCGDMSWAYGGGDDAEFNTFVADNAKSESVLRVRGRDRKLRGRMIAVPTKWRSKGRRWLAPAILVCVLLLAGLVLQVVRSNIINATVSQHINASAKRVQALYRDPDNWARLFPATIRSARVVRVEGDTTVVEVDHAEGKVVNILRDVSSARIELVEFKRRYDATFVNEFIPEGEGMRYRLTASVRLKWPYRLAGPFVKPLVLGRMRRYVVQPLKAAAEGERDRFAQ
jgi:hypothetical protein